MRVLIVTNMYPTKDTPYYGIFVSEQERAIKKYFPNVEFGIYNIRGDVNKSEYVLSLNRVYNEIEKGQYDLVHIHYGLSGLFLLNPFRKCKVPVVITLHGGDIQIEQGKKIQVFLTKRILRHVDFAITLNDRMDSITKHYINNTAIIPCSTDTDLFSPIGERPSSAGKNKVDIVFPSSHSRTVKNYPLFCEVVKVMKNKYGIECIETELDKMSREQVCDLYRRADAMLMTSISEGSPQVVKEAMSCNLPVITTKVGDVDILLDGVAGSGWVYPHDATLLADMLYNSLQGNIKGKTPRERIFELGLDDKDVATKIYAIYKTLLNER